MAVAAWASRYFPCKTWREETNFSNQAVEFCVAHVPGDEAEKLCRRRSMLAKRGQIMEA
jgi:hypothetical protein